MFPVEIRLGDHDEAALTEKMSSMREWLDHRRFEPSTFRYVFMPTGLIFCVHFSGEAEAIAFAAAFGGRIAEHPSDTTVQTAA